MDSRHRGHEEISPEAGHSRRGKVARKCNNLEPHIHSLIFELHSSRCFCGNEYNRADSGRGRIDRANEKWPRAYRKRHPHRGVRCMNIQCEHRWRWNDGATSYIYMQAQRSIAAYSFRNVLHKARSASSKSVVSAESCSVKLRHARRPERVLAHSSKESFFPVNQQKKMWFVCFFVIGGTRFSLLKWK